MICECELFFVSWVFVLLSLFCSDCMLWIFDPLYVHAQVLSLTRTLFNPAVIGWVLALVYILAWVRMEEIAESKRNSQNMKLLSKKTSLKDADEPAILLSDYSDKMNGVLFEKSGLSDMWAHIQSKGKVPLKMSAICQPVRATAGDGIVWQSDKLTIHEETIRNRSDLRERSFMSVREALQVIEPGFACVWKDPRKLLGKDTACHGNFDFHDPTNFLALFVNSNKFKRIGSVKLPVFLNSIQFGFDNQEVSFPNHPLFPRIKIPSSDGFFAIAIIASSVVAN